MTGAKRVSLLDLTVNQVEEIELEIGLPLAKWGEAPSLAKLYRLAYERATGESTAGMTMRQLTEAVSLDGDSDPNP